VKSALDWKQYYRAEREALGPDRLLGLLDRAPEVTLPERGALVFPHTRLAESGTLVAAAALAVVRSGRGEVLALGVLHGGREQDRALAQAARKGDEAATRELRRVHGPGAPDDDGRWVEEFSLDGFEALLGAAARREGRPAPIVTARFPFLTGAEPATLPGIDELVAIARRGAAIVATADPVHHGAGYDTPDRVPLDRAAAHARALIRRGLDDLAAGELERFLGDAAVARSDFRDSGPALVHVLRALGGRALLRASIHDLAVVDYASALDAADPTWVAGALISIEPA
jgi:hypothetical protein